MSLGVCCKYLDFYRGKERNAADRPSSHRHEPSARISYEESSDCTELRRHRVEMVHYHWRWFRHLEALYTRDSFGWSGYDWARYIDYSWWYGRVYLRGWWDYSRIILSLQWIQKRAWSILSEEKEDPHFLLLTMFSAPSCWYSHLRKGRYFVRDLDLLSVLLAEYNLREKIMRW